MGASTFNTCTVYTLTLICYDRLKMASIEVKKILSSCKTCMRGTVSVLKNTPTNCLRMCTKRTQHFPFMCKTEMGYICVSYKPLNASNNQLTIGCAFSYTETCSCSLRGSQTRMHACFRRSKWRVHNSFSLMRLFPCCKSRRNISTRSCHWPLWAVLRS